MKINPDWIDSAKMETRCNKNVRSLVVMVEPDVHTSSLGYTELVGCVKSMFIMMFADAHRWNLVDADVMMWSDKDRTGGIFVPYLYRVTASFRRDGTDEEGDNDDE